MLIASDIVYIVDIVDWWHDWFTSTGITCISIDPVMMFRPHHMTVQNLPVQYRAELVVCLQTALAHPMLQYSQPRLKDYLQGVLEFAQKSTVIYDQFELFLFDTARHDLANKTKMQVGNKKFYQLLDNKHKNLLDQFYHQLNSNLLPKDQQQIYRNLPL
jgi:hypothetical protein